MFNLRQILEFLDEEENRAINQMIDKLDEGHPIKTIRRIKRRLDEKAKKEAMKHGEKR